MGFGARELLRWQSDRMLRCDALLYAFCFSTLLLVSLLISDEWCWKCHSRKLKGEREFQDVADVFQSTIHLMPMVKLFSPLLRHAFAPQLPTDQPSFFHLPLGGVILPAGQAKNHLFSFLLKFLQRQTCSYTHFSDTMIWAKKNQTLWNFTFTFSFVLRISFSKIK